MTYAKICRGEPWLGFGQQRGYEGGGSSQMRQISDGECQVSFVPQKVTLAAGGEGSEAARPGRRLPWSARDMVVGMQETMNLGDDALVSGHRGE